MKNVWVLEHLDPNDGSEVDFDQYNLGIVEEDMFRTEATFFSEDMALRFLGAIRWFETFEDGAIGPALVPAKATRKKRSTTKEVKHD